MEYQVPDFVKKNVALNWCVNVLGEGERQDSNSIVLKMDLKKFISLLSKIEKPFMEKPVKVVNEDVYFELPIFTSLTAQFIGITYWEKGEIMKFLAYEQGEGEVVVVFSGALTLN